MASRAQFNQVKWKKILGVLGVILLAGASWSDGGLRADEGGAFVMQGPDDDRSAVEAMRVVIWDEEKGLLQVLRPGGAQLPNLVVLSGVRCLENEHCSLLRAGKFSRLVDVYRGLAKSGLDDELSRRGLAMSLYLSGDLQGAVRAYSWAATEKPDDPHVRIGMGSVMAELGMIEQARREFEPLVEGGDLAVVAWLDMGNAHRVGDEKAEALRCYDKAVALTPRLGAADYNRGMVLMDQGKPASAAEAFRRSTRRLGPFGDAYLLEGLTRLRAKETIGAAVALYRAEELGVESAALHLALGVACRDLNMNEQAAVYLRKAIDGGMVDQRIHQILAASLVRLGRSEQAAEVLEEGFVLGPKHADAHFMHGLKLFLVEQPEKAAEHLLEAVRLGKRDADAFFVLGQALMQTEQPGAAVSSLSAASKLKPSSPEIHFALGMALGMSNDQDASLREMKTALALAPADVDIARGLMEALMRSGDYAGCAKVGKNIVDLRPERIGVRFDAAFCQALHGDLDGASSALESALDQDLEGDVVHDLWRKLKLLSESDSERRLRGIYLLLALINEHRGNWSEATQAYEHFLLGRPNKAWTRRALGRIHSLSPRR
ncbi:MAG: tetratricopeptide repeat protein [Deltaproteobacteria bacterium]|nr:tetratricopeptide repeat protein [Deltaproteobacteria bacterium]